MLFSNKKSFVFLPKLAEPTKCLISIGMPIHSPNLDNYYTKEQIDAKIENLLDIEIDLPENIVTEDNIGTFIEDALLEAKESGEFKGEKGDKGEDGKDGYTPVKGVDYFDGKDGAQGIQGIQGEKGEQGPQGEIGPQGEQGPKGDKGDTGAVGPQGPQGEKGADGFVGADGATFTPNVDTNGNLSWSNDKGLTNPATVNIKGDKGEKGDKGDQGEQGIQGVAGKDGVNGQNGLNGLDGRDGKDGADGKTPVKGVDYFTDADKKELIADIDAYAGIPIRNNTSNTADIEPNVLNVWGEMITLNITLAPPTDESILNEYLIQFTSGATATQLTLPSDIAWTTDPIIEPNTTYIISIVNNIGVIGGA